MKRRTFITLLGGAAATWPMAARGQQQEMPVVGYLSTQSSRQPLPVLDAFRRGLSETGHVEGRTLKIEYRWADHQNSRLPELAADLVRRQVSVIATSPDVAARAAKAATTTIPIVFNTGGDPVATGLVASLNRPGGNLTGVTSLNVELAPKRLELIREVVPTAKSVALLINPTNPDAETLSRDLQEPARKLGLQLHLLRASAEGEFESVFESVARLKANALVIGTDPFFISQANQLGALTLRHAVPTIFQYREFAEGGGLMSYGDSLTDRHRLIGVYTGRILNGEKPADLPVQQTTKVELLINLKTAKTLGLTFPLTLLGRADAVIE